MAQRMLVIEHQVRTLQNHTRGMIRSRKIKRGTDLIFGVLPCIAANVEGASGEHRGDFPLPLQVSETVFIEQMRESPSTGDQIASEVT